MGLLMKSIRKSKAMKKAEQVMCEQASSFSVMMAHAQKEREAFEDLYKALSNMEMFKGIIEETTPEELMNIAEAASWIVERKGTDYLPVALVSFPKPLKYLLANKDTVLERKEDPNWQEIILRAVAML